MLAFPDTKENMPSKLFLGQGDNQGGWGSQLKPTSFRKKQDYKKMYKGWGVEVHPWQVFSDVGVPDSPPWMQMEDTDYEFSKN